MAPPAPRVEDPTHPQQQTPLPPLPPLPRALAAAAAAAAAAVPLLLRLPMGPLKVTVMILT